MVAVELDHVDFEWVRWVHWVRWAPVLRIRIKSNGIDYNFNSINNFSKIKIKLSNMKMEGGGEGRAPPSLTSGGSTRLLPVDFRTSSLNGSGGDAPQRRWRRLAFISKMKKKFQIFPDEIISHRN